MVVAFQECREVETKGRSMFGTMIGGSHCCQRPKVATIFNQQVPDSGLPQFVVSSDLQWLTGAILSEAALEFVLSVRESSCASHNLKGPYSWVGVNLNDSENVKQ